MSSLEPVVESVTVEANFQTTFIEVRWQGRHLNDQAVDWELRQGQDLGGILLGSGTIDATNLVVAYEGEWESGLYYWARVRLSPDGPWVDSPVVILYD